MGRAKTAYNGVKSMVPTVVIKSLLLSLEGSTLGDLQFLHCLPGRMNSFQGTKHIPGNRFGVQDILYCGLHGYETIDLLNNPQG